MWSGCTGCEKQNCLSTESIGELVSPSDPRRFRDSGWDDDICLKLEKTKKFLKWLSMQNYILFNKMHHVNVLHHVMMKSTVVIFESIFNRFKNWAVILCTYPLCGMGGRVRSLSTCVWSGRCLRGSWWERMAVGLAALKQIELIKPKITTTPN